MPHGLPDFWQGTVAGMPAIGAGQVAWFQSDSHLVTGGEDYDLINYVVPDTFELHVCSGVVSCELPRLQKYDLRQTPAATWISPTSHIDPDNLWTDEELCYDGDLATGGFDDKAPASWGTWLIFLINPTFVDKIRFNGSYSALYSSKIVIEVYYGGIWHEIYEGIFANRVWVEKALTDTFLVDKAKVRYYNPHPTARTGATLWEFQFNSKGVTPQEGIYFDTHAIIPYLPQAPYIVEPGAKFQVRVHNYDEVAQNMSVSLAGFLQKKTM